MVFKLGVFAAAMVAVTSPALAVQIPDGTAAFVSLFSPTVNIATPTKTVGFFGSTFEIGGNGGFSTVGNTFGTLAGTLNFSSVVGTTLSQSIANFFTFNDGLGGTFSFSLDSVQTQSYSVTPGVSQSFALYLLGTTNDVHLGYSATATSLTLTFNKTGNSAFSASGTLAIPPASLVPEPASWVMMLAGFGMIGGALRGRRKASVTFA